MAGYANQVFQDSRWRADRKWTVEGPRGGLLICYPYELLKEWSDEDWVAWEGLAIESDPNYVPMEVVEVPLQDRADRQETPEELAQTVWEEPVKTAPVDVKGMTDSETWQAFLTPKQKGIEEWHGSSEGTGGEEWQGSQQEWHAEQLHGSQDRFEWWVEQPAGSQEWPAEQADSQQELPAQSHWPEQPPAKESQASQMCSREEAIKNVANLDMALAAFFLRRAVLFGSCSWNQIFLVSPKRKTIIVTAVLATSS